MRRILTIVLYAAVLGVMVSGGFGCATYLDDLNRAERHYQSNQHERALALFRALERDMGSLSEEDRARYAYLRGINNYRMSGSNKEGTATETDRAFRSHARHWLALARSMERQKPGALRPEWKKNIEEALRDLNQDVFGVGVFPDEPTESGATGGRDSAGSEGAAEEAEEEEEDASEL